MHCIPRHRSKAPAHTQSLGALSLPLCQKPPQDHCVDNPRGRLGLPQASLYQTPNSLVLPFCVKLHTSLCPWGLSTSRIACCSMVLHFAAEIYHPTKQGIPSLHPKIKTLQEGHPKAESCTSYSSLRHSTSRRRSSLFCLAR